MSLTTRPEVDEVMSDYCGFDVIHVAEQLT
jgi:hypothetical protein